MKTELQVRLDENIPEEAIEHRTQGGKELSYLSGAYVINRLNQVLGQGNWSYQIVDLKEVWSGELEQYSGKAFSTSYIAQVELTARLRDPINPSITTQSSFTEVGYGDGADKKSPGKAHELATKEAVTDALKRAAKNLGISMGLGLYFKDGQYTAGTVVPTEEKVPARGLEVPLAQEVSAPAIKAPPVKALRSKIKSAFAVLQEQKKITKDLFVSEYTLGEKVDNLEAAQLSTVITKLQTNFPELGL